MYGSVWAMENSKYSVASKQRMAKIPKETRVANATAAGKARQASMSKEERKRHAKAMVNAREAKRNEHAK